ncbi:MAG: glycerol-3-phosphate 1-O-acyltransferase PlsY [Candidatus Rokubacteria bacterium]|nr:glycerol-3-phosphate 1-O-acyltransferase PlsY [Candidatus Rokubacteria bacterium]
MALSLSAVVLAYLIGAIPIGYAIARARGVDIRRVGSGNIGATNVLRRLGKGAAFATLLGDVAKGALAVHLGLWLGGGAPSWGAAAAALAVAGNCWSPFLGFKGGKGVATALGTILRLVPWATLPAALVWVVILLTFRYVSLASVTAAAGLPLGLFLLRAPGPVLLSGLLIAALIVFRHQKNLGRLFQGTEPKLGQSAASP